MIQTSEILYSILLISICVLIMVYYRNSLNSLYNRAIMYCNIYKSDIVSSLSDAADVETTETVVPNIDINAAYSTENYFNTEYEITENAGDAITNALKDL